MSKLLILDKDGTLVTPASGKKFVHHPEDQVVLPGVHEAIAQPKQFLAWVDQGKILTASSIHLLPGEDFYCLYFTDTSFLKPFEALPPER